MSIIMFIVYLQTLSMSRARTRLEGELARRRRMESHLNVALRAGAVGIWDSDLKSGMAWTDERTAQLFGVVRGPDGTVPFEEWKSKVHVEDRHKVDGAIDAMMTRNAKGKMRYRVVRPDGELRYIEGTGAAVAGEDGTIVSHVGTVTDVTERRRRERDREKNERERRALEEQLLQAQKREVMGTLAGGIAHDFNNLLAAIQNFAALIESDGASSQESRQFAGRILAGCGRGKDIVAQILTFARTSGQRQEVLDLAQFLGESEPLLSPAVARGARLSLPARSAPLWVRGNPGQLLQLIANLCVNAGEALTEKMAEKSDETRGETGGEIAVTLITASRAQIQRLAEAAPSLHAHSIGQVNPSLSYALLCVRDDGPGMTTDVLKRVFDPFFTTKGRQYGSGLGLSVCQGIVESHRGFCLVESAPGKGTRFSVLLPLEDAPAILPEPQGAGPITLGFERILVVDDDPDVLDSMALGLKRLGYKVIGFTDPSLALKTALANPGSFDLVIADRIMPGLYGPDLLEKIRRADPQIRTILCSGHAEESDDGPQPAVDLILAKPLSAQELTAAVRDLLKSS
jgi:signal transduction histidine kinase